MNNEEQIFELKDKIKSLQSDMTVMIGISHEATTAGERERFDHDIRKTFHDIQELRKQIYRLRNGKIKTNR